MTRFGILPVVRIAGAILLILICGAGHGAAGPLPEGEKQIVLVAADGTRLRIGKVGLKSAGEARTIDVKLDAPEFEDQFLSMRPFRCLPDTKEVWCHLAYPYATHGTISSDDLVDLEYALLFLFKSPTGYGIDAWNGLYFKLEVTPQGAISGTLHEADFNVLAVPPASGVTRPIAHGVLTPVAPEAHRFARIEIE